MQNHITSPILKTYNESTNFGTPESKLFYLGTP
jgi:hypothetical protein